MQEGDNKNCVDTTEAGSWKLGTDRDREKRH